MYSLCFIFCSSNYDYWQFLLNVLIWFHYLSYLSFLPNFVTGRHSPSVIICFLHISHQSSMFIKYNCCHFKFCFIIFHYFIFTPSLICQSAFCTYSLFFQYILMMSMLAIILKLCFNIFLSFQNSMYAFS